MYDTVTNSSSTTPQYTLPAQELLSYISLSPRTQVFKDSFGWFYPHDPNTKVGFENWQESISDTTVQADTTPSPLPRTLKKLPTINSSNMPSRTAEKVDGSAVAGDGRRWRLTPSGQVVDLATWDLADNIGRLKIGDVTPENGDARAPIRTPPKSKLAAAMNSINDSSPLDSSSNTSVGSSPQVPEHPISHSRGSSADTTFSSSRDSISGNALLAHPPLKSAGAPSAEAKERPHSFSGGLSSADLRRLQQVGDNDHELQMQQQWSQNQYREQNAEQLSYPSLSNQVHRPIPQQAFNYPNPQLQQANDRDDVPLDYNSAQQQRNFASVPPHVNHVVLNNVAGGPTPPQFSRPTNAVPPMNYRQTNRNFAPQGPTPQALGYAGAHTSHLSLGNTQQLYEMMLPGPPHENHPAVTRVQQQHNVFRGNHHHSASDPSAIRDVAALQLLNSNMQTFNPSMFQPGMPQAMPLYPNQYYAPQELVVQQAMAARLQAQYTGSYNVAPATPNPPIDSGVASPTSSSGATGPSANNRKLGLYKTELCRSWEEKGTCRYGAKCQFAHGEDELRKVQRHPKYKTEICKTFWVSGSCPYGKRCCFIHTELSSANTPATAGAAENTPPQPQSDGRERSNSDPDTSASISLLSRIQRSQQESSTNSTSTPVDANSSNGFQFTRPPTGSLRVDTTVLDGVSMKQNKSAYPSFASNGILLPAPEHITAKSPAPVTAGPDLGRHNLARMEIVGYPNHQKKNSTSSTTNSNPRHSFNGSDVDLNFSPSPPASGHAFGHNINDNVQPAPARGNGHVRAGSAGNWGSITRSSHLSTASAYPHATNAAGEIMSNSPWSSTELAVGSTRLHEKNWV
ncbi:hypothetical protein CPB84DRAFT_1749619 [Gymnopilus junonius]|uniref:C3H1-type domain-containing protein n=1 Tax=Gymnopilus junonius TaxID=109634 RepID=A0A9P5NHF5_GYMJU|nr:hypothetical protein CPB84DRAFT_1749619 [Gymnopilus junonius]